MHNDSKTTQQPGLRRELKARHLTMIAIGGSIGTGLFVASGATISQAGPGGAQVAVPLPRLTRTLYRIHHRQKHLSNALNRFLAYCCE
ncbi:hypothetical protein CRX72_22470 [Pantoea sp. BRM17]|nr:hypothetical protein CRX72_22470 [Pantoea sp. BRM17]